jgi:predicted acyltransferase
MGFIRWNTVARRVTRPAKPVYSDPQTMTTQSLTAPAQSSERDLTQPTPGRLVSVDVYRGLAVGGMILVDNPGSDEGAYWPIRHAAWNGWTPADLIFPSFMFLVGVSMVFSFSARLRRGEKPAQILFHAFKRSLILIALGIFVNAMPIYGLDLHTWRMEGVLQRIAVCYFVAAILVLWSNPRGQIIALVACLLGYWAILRFVPVPGFGVPGRDIPFMDPERNLVAWLDRALFPGRLYNGTRDPEGIISNLPAIGTVLLGVLTGQWLRSHKTDRTKAAGMLAAGILGLSAGLLWTRWFPINKNLWTSSFVLFTGGFALIFLTLLYWVLEIKKWRGLWTMPFLVFGVNAILGFVADSLVYGPGYTFTTTGPGGDRMSWHQAAHAGLQTAGLSVANASLIYSIGAVLFCWFLLWLFWQKRIFIKI